MTANSNDPLSALNRDVTPPDLLKRRVIGSLRGRGLLHPRRQPVWRTLTTIAAALALFVSGIGVGRRSPALVADRSPSYALLLYEGREFDRQTPEHAYVAEYSAWAASLRDRGLLAGGQALAPDARLLSDSGDAVSLEARDVVTEEGTMAGFFIIHAASYAEAQAIAMTCPHLRHGGRIALRRIVPT